MKKSVLIFSLSCFAFFLTTAQTPTFTDASATLLPNNTISSGAPIGVADVNGDSRDDLVRLDNLNDLYVEYQNADGTFTSYNFGTANSQSWSLSLGDVDNDGFAEFLTGGAYNNVNLLLASGTASYTNSVLNGPGIFVQGSNFADINNDGFLDAYACHDDGPNCVWMNDGTGALFHSTTAIDFNLYPADPGNGLSDDDADSGNYGSTWTDFDCDGDLDLYIAKCRGGVTDPTDVRRINQLWVNDGSNNFTESAATYALDDGGQSWVADFQDIDNDGDFDIFILNHDVDSRVIENQNGTYVDITATTGLTGLSGPLFQNALKDFNNDGYVDLLITDHFYLNNGDKTFTEITPNPFGNLNSFGLGDLNQDGFIDVYACYGSGFNSATGTPDQLWLNDRNDNSFLSVNLVGTTSNRNAVGAKIELVSEVGTQVREVRAGESYGVTHSFTQTFGLGDCTNIVSLTVKWPSGLVENFTDIHPNQILTIKEGTCISPNIRLATSQSLTLCTGGSVDISAPSGFTYNWSTGATGESISVSTAGTYKVTVSDGTDCFTISETLNVLIDDATCNDPCNQTLYLAGTNASGTYSAKTFLTSKSQILSPENVTYNAGKCLLMEDGFEVEAGSEFLGQIQTCN